MTIYPQYAAGCAGTYSMVKVTDVDLDRKTILSNEFFGSFKDLRSNGTDTLVIGQEVSGEVYFFWAYEWDGVKWANRNRKYFDLYKDEPLRPIGYCAASGSDMLNELVKEIAEGVPLKYWKK
jgi:hypothetical protein